MAIMNRSIAMRLLAVGILIAAEIAAATALLVVAPEPGAQRFEDFFPFFQQIRSSQLVRSPRAGCAATGLFQGART
jgi:hypothetical protein